MNTKSTTLSERLPETESRVAELNRLITKSNAAEILSISTRTLDRICDRGVLEKIYVGGMVRYRLQDILAIVERGL